MQGNYTEQINLSYIPYVRTRVAKAIQVYHSQPRSHHCSQMCVDDSPDLVTFLAVAGHPTNMPRF